MLEIIAFDADDTLWENEQVYIATQAKLQTLLANYGHNGDVEHALYEQEKQNLPYFGYGIKSFTFSMLETALRLTEGNIRAADIQHIIDLGKAMIDTPTKLLPHVEETIAQLAGQYRLMLITKGDLLDQERKLDRSGLKGYFAWVEIVSEKTPATYQTILEKHSISPQHFVMVGNSLRSDILPVLEVGAHAIHILHQSTWIHEMVEEPTSSGYHELDHIGLVPELLPEL